MGSAGGCDDAAQDIGIGLHGNDEGEIFVCINQEPPGDAKQAIFGESFLGVRARCEYSGECVKYQEREEKQQDNFLFVEKRSVLRCHRLWRWSLPLTVVYFFWFTKLLRGFIGRYVR
jgi:hypothetical protein